MPRIDIFMYMDLLIPDFLHTRQPFEWGDYEHFVHEHPTTVKIIVVHSLQILSLQYHHHRDEWWYIIAGSGYAHIGDERKVAQPRDKFFVPRTTIHRLEGGEQEEMSLLEIALGMFDENDIVRLEDKYGRT